MRPLFPEINVNQTYLLEVSGGHQIYVEESGNPDGIPVVYCHGGPGGGSDPLYRRFYDPQKYRIILFDQRGCGQSIPNCIDGRKAIAQNTTQDLMADMEVIRNYLSIEKWVVAGGSWGSTLALLYGIQHPQSSIGFILRGIFLARQQDLAWLFGNSGAAQVFPEYYQQFVQGAVNNNVDELLSHYQQLLESDNELERLAAAKQFCYWEAKLATLKTPAKVAGTAKEFITKAVLNCHYFSHHSFIEENQILNGIAAISHLPAYIVHGRYDVVCKAENAFSLHQALPESTLEFVADAGHSCTELGIIDGLVKASIAMAKVIENKPSI
jgi:proline iminopeptidase